MVPAAKDASEGSAAVRKAVSAAAAGLIGFGACLLLGWLWDLRAGSAAPAGPSAALLFVAAGLAVHLDLSRRQLRRERARAEREVRETAALKVKFASMVSHELRTPLASIRLGIDEVLNGSAGAINEEQGNYLAVAKRNVDRLTRLINDILDYQRLDSGQIPLRMAAADINALVAEAARFLQPAAQAKDLALATDLAAGLPPVSCDRDRISQVLGNLIGNAVKFSPRGKVTVRTSRQGRGVRVTVQDEGPGVRPEDRGKLFQSFSQVVPAGAKKDGTGLGLAISRRIIEGHGGEIGVESGDGQGAVFFFALPAQGQGG